ncbi:sugar ABC transporter permease [Paenibacillus lautus]|uniref:ABC transporter permease n=1 Tax=Paenibacillus lautus TaxID=1401 RepID=UPI001B0D5CB7|nr:ABC transporter permease subunit [Paenibacillus lautus]GIO98346.1 sugar ABC transporter permease [Paenibacillus lautus]
MPRLNSRLQTEPSLDQKHPLQLKALPEGERGRSRRKQIKRHWQLYLVLLLPVLYLIIFKYVPMAGIVIAFKNYNVIKGIWGSDWVGLKYFHQFFDSPNFWLYIKNTLGISFYGLIVGFPAPILLALALNEIRNGLFKKTVQMVSYAPYFISTVIMVSIIVVNLTPNVGMISKFFEMLGMSNTNFMGIPGLFKSIYVWSDVWQFTGYGAIIYIAALSGVNPELYESAKVDGASRIQKILNIDIPSLIPVSVILLILNLGNIMKLGFEKIYLMQNPLNLSTSEVISTYVYKVGLLGSSFSFSTAIGLFNSVINLILLVSVNYIARKLSNSSLW